MVNNLIKIPKSILKWAGIVFLSSVVLIAVLAGYFFIAHNQPLVLPSPTGSYNIGRTEYDWVDDKRIDRLSNTASEKRELLVWVWYPVSGQGSQAPFLPPAWLKASAKEKGIGRFLESNYSQIQTHSFSNAPFGKAQGKYPVILMQPGMGPMPTDYTVFAENLASHGYIVVGINPTYTSNLIVFPDGRVAQASEKGTIPDSADAATVDADANRIGKVWMDDAIFVMNRLQSLSVDKSSFFYQRLDLVHMGVFGHSFGGATAARVCKIDARCKAGADLDGTLFSYQAEGTLHTPFMFMAEDSCGKDCDTMLRAYTTSNSDAYYLSIKGAGHFNFSDLPLRWLPPTRVLLNGAGLIGSIRPERGLEITNAYLVAFFDRYLKNIASSLLQDSSYPEVQFKRRQP